jgi:[acyl-carrier-protein] S-malonyltransferase
MKTPDQLDAARALLAEHSSLNDEPPGDGLGWRIVVAPGTGTLRYVTKDETVRAGTELGVIEARGGAKSVNAPCDGNLVEWLAEDGDPVSEGQPLARLEPAQ